MIRRRYDPESSSLAMGIGDFLRIGSLPASLASEEPWLDLQFRSRMHLQYQSSYCEQNDVEGEVPVELETGCSGYTFRISGRLDILDDTSEPPVVIEVKTRATELHPEADPVRDFPEHVLQLAFYCRALASEETDGMGERARPGGRLVYLILDREKPREQVFEIDAWGEGVEGSGSRGSTWSRSFWTASWVGGIFSSQRSRSSSSPTRS